MVVTNALTKYNSRVLAMDNISTYSHVRDYKQNPHGGQYQQFPHVEHYELNLDIHQYQQTPHMLDNISKARARLLKVTH